MTEGKSGTSAATGAGVGMGAVLAGLISWDATQSLLWTILHMIEGWFYVIYCLFVHKAHLGI